MKFRNHWNIDKESGFITFFEVLWQFDCYAKYIQLTLFNFSIEIGN